MSESLEIWHKKLDTCKSGKCAAHEIKADKMGRIEMNKVDVKEKVAEIYHVFYAGRDEYIVTGDEASVPIVLANLVQSTKSFTAKQQVYIYDGHWGMSERLLVIGKYRARHRLIEGHCEIKNLIDFRPRIMFNPVLIKKLKNKRISIHLFSGFSDPEGPYLLK